jgi:hypothetical protein
MGMDAEEVAMPAGELPPVPDESGEPRPPAAPRVAGPWQGERHRLSVVHHQAGDQRFVKSTGRRRHPLLESVAARPPAHWRSAALGAVYAIVPAAVVIAVVLWFTAGDRTAAYLVLAGVAAAVAVLFVASNASYTTTVLRAGAHAVAEVDVDGVGADLPLYELRSISVTDSRRGLALRLVGPDEQRLTLPFGLLEANQQLWDLVYNGIRHSAAAGAEVDERARDLLALPPPRGPEPTA